MASRPCARRASRYSPFGLLRRQVDAQNAIDARCRGVLGEALDAVGVNRVEVGEEDDRHAELRLQPRHQRENAHQRRARGESARRRGLIHRPVGDRVAERHAELEDVGARRRESDGKPLGRREIRIAGGDVGDERRPSFRPGAGEGLRQRLRRSGGSAGCERTSGRR